MLILQSTYHTDIDMIVSAFAKMLLIFNNIYPHIILNYLKKYKVK